MPFTEIIVLLIIFSGFPLMLFDYLKYPKMYFVFFGYLFLAIGGIFALFGSAGPLDVFPLFEHLSIMIAGMLFAASAFYAHRRMVKVVGK